MPIELFQLPSYIQLQYLPYITPFSLVWLLLAFLKIDMKIVFAMSAIAAIAIAFTPLSSIISNIIALVGYSTTLLIAMTMIIVGLVVGRKSFAQIATPRDSLSIVHYQQELRNLEREKSDYISQLQHVGGDYKREKTIEEKINSINNKINVIKAKLGIPIT